MDFDILNVVSAGVRSVRQIHFNHFIVHMVALSEEGKLTSYILRFQGMSDANHYVQI